MLKHPLPSLVPLPYMAMLQDFLREIYSIFQKSCTFPINFP